MVVDPMEQVLSTAAGSIRIYRQRAMPCIISVVMDQADPWSVGERRSQQEFD